MAQALSAISNLSISCSIVSQKASIRCVPVPVSLIPCGVRALTANKMQCLVRSVTSCGSEYSEESSLESVRGERKSQLSDDDATVELGNAYLV